MPARLTPTNPRSPRPSGEGWRWRLHASLAAVLLSSAPGLVAIGTAAETHPFTVRDLVAFDRLSDPRVSPDGRWVAFTVSAVDLDANRRRNDLWLVAVDGTNLRRLTTHEASDTSPRWSADGKSLWFLSTRSGSSQVWNCLLYTSPSPRDS